MSNTRDFHKGLFSLLAGKEKRVRSTGEGVSALFERLGGKERGRLNRLWTDWDTVMGSTVASLSRPLGHDEGTLLVGADDAMAMQDLSLLSPEILDRANEHMGGPFFVKVSVRLMQGRPDLARRREPLAEPRPRPPYTPERVGRHLGALNPDSPVTRCYERHARAGKNEGEDE